MATVALQRAVADLPAMRARRGGGDTDPPGPGTLRQPRGDRRNSPARPCTPAPCAQRGTLRSACAKFYRPSKVLQNRQPAAKNHRPPRDKFYPTDTPTPWGSATTPFARTSAFPRRAGEPRRPQHMRALCFPCSRALPTCRAGGTPAAPPPRKPRGKQRLKLVGAGRGHTLPAPGATFTRSVLRERYGRHRRPPHRPHAGNAAHRAGGRAPAGGGKAPHAATRATGSTCHASPRLHVFPSRGVYRPPAPLQILMITINKTAPPPSPAQHGKEESRERLCPPPLCRHQLVRAAATGVRDCAGSAGGRTCATRSALHRPEARPRSPRGEPGQPRPGNGTVQPAFSNPRRSRGPLRELNRREAGCASSLRLGALIVLWGVREAGGEVRVVGTGL